MCDCKNYGDLEFDRKVISRRIRESRTLKKHLELLAKHGHKEHKLYRCSDCSQLWQGSRAWVWGNEEYLFRVPTIEVEAWKNEVYVQPDELMMFGGRCSDYLSENVFDETLANCAAAGCPRRAVSGTVQCLRHHVESLQRIGSFPRNPVGRWFGQYVRANTIPDL